MLTRGQFYYLFVHANSLAELGLRFAAAEIEGDLELETDEQFHGTEDLANTVVGIHDLDFEALDSLGDQASPVGNGCAPSDRDCTPDPGSGPVDLDDYLERAYAQEERLRSRIDAAFEEANSAQLHGLLGRAPAELPSLTVRLGGEELDRWLTLYKVHDEVVSEIVLLIRQLDG